MLRAIKKYKGLYEDVVNLIWQYGLDLWEVRLTFSKDGMIELKSEWWDHRAKEKQNGFYLHLSWRLDF